jgi:hypothetical protein
VVPVQAQENPVSYGQIQGIFLWLVLNCSREINTRSILETSSSSHVVIGPHCSAEKSWERPGYDIRRRSSSLSNWFEECERYWIISVSYWREQIKFWPNLKKSRSYTIVRWPRYSVLVCTYDNQYLDRSFVSLKPDWETFPRGTHWETRPESFEIVFRAERSDLLWCTNDSFQPLKTIEIWITFLADKMHNILIVITSVLLPFPLTAN